jgi:hypothetical protein
MAAPLIFIGRIMSGSGLLLKKRVLFIALIAILLLTDMITAGAGNPPASASSVITEEDENAGEVLEEPPQVSGNALGDNFWYVVAAFGTLILFMRVYMINRKYSRRYAGDRPYTLKTKQRYAGDKEFDNIRVEIIELDDDE